MSIDNEPDTKPVKRESSDSDDMQTIIPPRFIANPIPLATAPAGGGGGGKPPGPTDLSNVCFPESMEEYKKIQEDFFAGRTTTLDEMLAKQNASSKDPADLSKVNFPDSMEEYKSIQEDALSSRNGWGFSNHDNDASTLLPSDNNTDTLPSKDDNTQKPPFNGP